MTITSTQHLFTLLSYCKTLKTLLQFHAHAAKTALLSDLHVAGNLLLHLSLHPSPAALRHAASLLRHTPNPDTFMYNTLIRGFSDSPAPQHSLSTFSLLLSSPNPVDTFSLAFTIKAAANMRCFSTGSQLHCQGFRRGLETHVFVGTTLVSMYGECGVLEFARKLFDEMPERNVVTWNALLTAFLRCGDMEGGEGFFGSMPVRDSASYNLMLVGYARIGELGSARQLFDGMPVKDEVSWSTVIAGLAGRGCFDEVFGWFRELRRTAGVGVNEVSLTGVLSACAQAGALEFARVLHGFVEKVGLVWVTAVSNALTDAYSKCGRVDMAQLVFRGMESGERNVVSWTSMILGLAIQGYGQEAISLFREMEESGIGPDGVAFVAILYACSHAGLIEQGEEIFEKMTKVYGIEPEIEHYGCMVDLYGRAGQLLKAYDFVSEMPIPPNVVIWRTLLGACSFYGNVKLAEQVKKRLSELDPNNSGDHVLLANIYAVAGKWKDAVTVRKSMAEMKMVKTPGWSMIEVDKVMYTFIAGAKQDDLTNEAYEKLKEIMSKLRVEGGYVPVVANVLHDIEEEEKEDAVVTHSEKLAVAFGMSRLAKGSAIRVVKNLRVCKDCHGVMKLISKVYEVEILLRDRSRFHSFKNGVCSCRDYW